MNRFERDVERLARVVNWIAAAAIVAMMAITCADVVLRFFRMPIPGAYEIVRFLGAFAVAFAMGYVTAEKGHVAVTFMIQRLSARSQTVCEITSLLFSIGLFLAVGQQSLLYAADLRRVGEVSLALGVPLYPIVYGIGFAAFVVCLVLLSSLIHSMAGLKKAWSRQ
jgi:TRAP-type C4-dicarboxylate transport system permease small subunit